MYGSLLYVIIQGLQLCKTVNNFMYGSLLYVIMQGFQRLKTKQFSFFGSPVIVVICVGLAVSAVTADAKVDVVGTLDVAQLASSAAVDVDAKEDAGMAENEAVVSTAIINSLDAVDDQTKSFASTHAADAGSSCFLRRLSDSSQCGTVPASNKSGAVFWKSSWRQRLCRCSTCLVNVVVHCLLCCVERLIQGGHLSGKPGNVREFDGCHGNVRDFTKNRKNLVRDKLPTTVYCKLHICVHTGI